MSAREVAVVQRHRTWCSLWAELPWCDCRQLDAGELVAWWAGQARRPIEPPAVEPVAHFGPLMLWGPADVVDQEPLVEALRRACDRILDGDGL